MCSKIKLLFVHPTVSFGGVERTMKNLLNNLNDDFFVSYLTSNEIINHLPKEKIHEFIPLNELNLSLWYTDDFVRLALRETRILCDIVEKAKPDLVIGLMYYASTLLSLGKLMGLLKKNKVISSPRGPLIPFFESTYRGFSLNNLAIKMSLYLQCRKSDALIVASKGLKDECIRLGAKERNVYVIPNSIELKEIEEAQPIKDSFFNSGFILCASGRFTEEKDFASIIMATEQLIKEGHDIKLVLIGDGHLRSYYEDEVKSMGISDYILFTGFVKNPFSYMKSCHLFCHACKYEGFGNVLLEAMACGLPVISTDCPYGPRDIVQDGINGYLVPMDDHLKFVEKIKCIINNKTHYNTLSQNALKRAREFTATRMANSYMQVFYEMMRR